MCCCEPAADEPGGEESLTSVVTSFLEDTRPSMCLTFCDLERLCLWGASQSTSQSVNQYTARLDTVTGIGDKIGQDKTAQSNSPFHGGGIGARKAKRRGAWNCGVRETRVCTCGEGGRREQPNEQGGGSGRDSNSARGSRVMGGLRRDVLL